MLFSALGSLTIGLAMAGYIIFLALSALQNGDCIQQGMSLICKNYAAGMAYESTINLPIALVAFFGGLAMVVRAGSRLVLLNRSRGKIIEHVYECQHCGHSWVEDLTAIPETATA